MKKTCYIIIVIFVFVTTPLLANNKSDPNVFELGEVIVTGAKQVVNLATTVDEVTIDDITSKGAQTIAEALEFIPGITIAKSGKNESHVSVRGFEQRQVKVLIDGVPAHETYFGTVDLSMLPIDAVSKITIIKGASSVLYGSNTLGGVINIITKKGGKIPYTSFTTSFGDNGTSNYTVNHGATIGNFNYWFSGGYHTSDGFNLSDNFDKNNSVTGLGTQYNEDGGKRDLSYYDKKNFNLKIGYEPNENTSIYLTYDYIDSNRGIPTFSNRYWEFSNWDQSQISLAGEHIFSKDFRMKGRIFYVKHDNALSDVSWDKDHTTSGKKWLEKSYYDDTSIGAEIQSQWDLAKTNSLKIGINFIKDNHKQSDYLSADCYNIIKGWNSIGWLPEEEYNAETYTFAVEDEIRPVDNVAVVIGLSFDSFEPTKTYDQPKPGSTHTLNPQAGIVFDLNDQTTLHSSIGKKTRFPALKELYSELAGGNPDLQAEKVLAYEIGGSHVFSNTTNGSVAMFHNEITDLISYINQEYININEATISGFEANLDIKLSSNISTDLNYTFMTTVDKSNDDRELEGKPNHRINSLLNYQFQFGLSANLQATYCQSQYWLNDNSEWEKLPDYLILNTKFIQDLGKISQVNAELFLQISNLTDLDYYETNGPEPGRNILIGLTMKI